MSARIAAAGSCPAQFAPRSSGELDSASPSVPASRKRVHLSYDRQEVARFASMVRDIPPEKR